MRMELYISSDREDRGADQDEPIEDQKGCAVDYYQCNAVNNSLGLGHNRPRIKSVVVNGLLVHGYSAVVVMRRSRTARTPGRSNRQQSPAGPVNMRRCNSWGRQIQLWVEIGFVYNVSCKPQSCQKQKNNYSTA